MGGSGMADPERSPGGRRPIRFTFAAMVAVPAACLVVLWAVTLSMSPGAGLAARFSARNHRELTESALLCGAALSIVPAAAILRGLSASRLSRDLSDLAAAAARA